MNSLFDLTIKSLIDNSAFNQNSDIEQTRILKPTLFFQRVSNRRNFREKKCCLSAASLFLLGNKTEFDR